MTLNLKLFKFYCPEKFANITIVLCVLFLVAKIASQKKMQKQIIGKNKRYWKKSEEPEFFRENLFTVFVFYLAAVHYYKSRFMLIFELFFQSYWKNKAISVFFSGYDFVPFGLRKQFFFFDTASMFHIIV